MKKSLFSTIFIALVFTLLAGCAPKPDAACAHMVELMKNDPDKPRFLEDEDSCIDRMEKVKQRHGVNSYRREVECALQATTGYKLRTCMETESRKRGGPKVM